MTIALLLVGIFSTLVLGEISFPWHKSVRGLRARMMGIVYLLFLPAAYLICLLLGFDVWMLSQTFDRFGIVLIDGVGALSVGFITLDLGLAWGKSRLEWELEGLGDAPFTYPICAPNSGDQDLSQILPPIDLDNPYQTPFTR